MPLPQRRHRKIQYDSVLSRPKKQKSAPHKVNLNPPPQPSGSNDVTETPQSFHFGDLEILEERHQQRMALLTDPRAREHLELAKSKIDDALRQCGTNAVRVDVDYKGSALAHDKARTETFSANLGHDGIPNANLCLPSTSSLPSPPVLIDLPGGCVVEDKRGIPLIYQVSGLIPDEYQKLLVESGSAFSGNFPFNSSSYRCNFKKDPASPFTSGQAHFCVWNAIGHMNVHPVPSTDLKRRACRPLWEALLTATQVVGYIFNMVVERLDPPLYESYKRLKRAIIDKYPNHPILERNPFCLPSLAIHFDMDVKDTHFDGQSLWCGYDGIIPLGPFFDATLQFPGLGLGVRSNPGDIFLVRGAGLAHTAGGWKGAGRMVFAPFADRRLYGWFRVARPITTTRLYGSKYSAFRKQHPSRTLHDVASGG